MNTTIQQRKKKKKIKFIYIMAILLAIYINKIFQF